MQKSDGKSLDPVGFLFSNRRLMLPVSADVGEVMGAGRESVTDSQEWNADDLAL
jgi:hypothetical protein